MVRIYRWGPTHRRRLVNPGALLDAWAEQWQTRTRERSSTWYTFVENPRHLLARIAETIVEKQVDFPWAFTGAAAGNVLAPLLTSIDTVDLIIPKGYTDDMADMLRLKPVKGANVTITEREGASLLLHNRILNILHILPAHTFSILISLMGEGETRSWLSTSEIF